MPSLWFLPLVVEDVGTLTFNQYLSKSWILVVDQIGHWSLGVDIYSWLLVYSTLDNRCISLWFHPSFWRIALGLTKVKGLVQFCSYPEALDVSHTTLAFPKGKIYKETLLLVLPLELGQFGIWSRELEVIQESPPEIRQENEIPRVCIWFPSSRLSYLWCGPRKYDISFECISAPLCKRWFKGFCCVCLCRSLRSPRWEKAIALLC